MDGLESDGPGVYSSFNYFNINTCSICPSKTQESMISNTFPHLSIEFHREIEYFQSIIDITLHVRLIDFNSKMLKNVE